LDFSLVSNKNFSEKLPSNGLGPGPGKMGQVGLKVLQFWHHSQKKQNQQFFFHCNLQDLSSLFSVWTAL